MNTQQKMVNYFGSDGVLSFLFNPLSLLFGAIFVLGAFIFRKTIANDSMGQEFSVIGSSAAGFIGYIIFNNILSSTKYAFLIGLLAWGIGGFLLAPLIGDGESS